MDSTGWHARRLAVLDRAKVEDTWKQQAMTQNRTGSSRPLQLRGLDHVVLRCARFDETLAFYCDLLGCTVERVVEEEGLYQLRAGSALIDLVPVGSRLGGTTAPRAEHFNVAHICLLIEPPDWEQLRAYFGEHGDAPGAPRNRYGAGGFGPSIYIEDPEGNQVELKAANE